MNPEQGSAANPEDIFSLLQQEVSVEASVAIDAEETLPEEDDSVPSTTEVEEVMWESNAAVSDSTYTEQVNVRHAPGKKEKAYRLRYAFFFSYFGIEFLHSGVICLLTPFSCSVSGQDSDDQHQEHANGIEVHKRNGCRRHCKVISELS